MSQELKNRTKKFAIDCWYLCTKIPKSREYNSYVRQLLRNSSSVAANYRATLRGKSDKDFLNKLKIVEEEADESMFWLELLKEIESQNQPEIIRLHNEAEELLKITVASINSTKKRLS